MKDIFMNVRENRNKHAFLKPFVIKQHPEYEFIETCFYIYDIYSKFTNDPMFSKMRECRGIVYNRKTGVVYPGIKKFFNFNQFHEFSDEVVGNDKVIRSYDKKDGSLIIPYEANGEVLLKTIGSFDNEVLDKLYDEIELKDIKSKIKYLHKQGKQPLFEYISPNNRIVIPYDEPKLCLVAVRNMSDFSFDLDLDKYKELFQVTESKSYGMNVREKYLQLKDVKGVEGEVIYTDKNEILKIKTDEYFKRHVFNTISISSTKTQIELIRAIFDGTDDDIIASNNYVLPIVNKLKEKLFADIDDIYNKANKYKKYEIKDIAEQVRKEKYSSVIFKLLRKDINFKNVKNELRSYLFSNKKEIKQFISEV